MIKAESLPLNRRQKKTCVEVCTRGLVILCTLTAVILSSISVCDGHWLFAGNKVFGLWHFCTISQNNDLECTRNHSIANVPGLHMGVIVSRSFLSFAVVMAIFGLELLIISQICEDSQSKRKWSMGSTLLVLTFLLSASGVLCFVFLLKNYISFTGFTLSYWCEFIAAFLFFLNGISGIHLNSVVSFKNHIRKIQRK
ncbi:voltage-dependent calcium channel gamma-like subunit [Protopterus annectens]|uniref:voltage-dependent calcium channel gamma-like subunit n=1 Tax=Protopterus annectens TaxID=7888 RepID=UPI001CFADB99|nr:voltage-dependent calcium channel gamma-like subunit [Protopterus annectens]XP_043929693.1 voltage-dependent calcium channel gamma-like subunit [Protopterus annectens]